ncbi:hypothetical protein KR222_008877 [Zaprionus bogoriensis]|nr:hypothetical protein KR222_008877 [Zaprionus bogoriensis]
MSQSLRRVFVYGTLKRGEPNHHWLTSKENGVSRFVSAGETALKFPLVIGTRYNIPFLLDKPGVGHHVQGEIYEVDDSMFARLDVLEEYPDYYDREQQAITTPEHDTLDCWVYLMRKYPESMLGKQLLSSYHDTPEQRYTAKSVRDAALAARDDLAY